MRRQRGVVLLLVLWLMALLSVVLMKLSGEVGTAMQSARWQRDSVRGEYLLQQQLAQAILAISSHQDDTRWLLRHRRMNWQQGTAKGRVAVQSVRGLIDLNEADVKVLHQLAGHCQLKRGAAWQHWLVQRRDKKPLLSVAELAQFKDLSTVENHCLTALSTVWSGEKQPERLLLPSGVHLALAPQPTHTKNMTGDIYRLTLTLKLSDGYRHQQQVTVLLGSRSPQGRPYRILRWQES